MNDKADKIRHAPNANVINALLPDDMALVSSGRRLWTVTESGDAKGFPESFDDARRRVADMVATYEE